MNKKRIITGLILLLIATAVQARNPDESVTGNGQALSTTNASPVSSNNSTSVSPIALPPVVALSVVSSSGSSSARISPLGSTSPLQRVMANPNLPQAHTIAQPGTVQQPQSGFIIRPPTPIN